MSVPLSNIFAKSCWHLCLTSGRGRMRLRPSSSGVTYLADASALKIISHRSNVFSLEVTSESFGCSRSSVCALVSTYLSYFTASSLVTLYIWVQCFTFGRCLQISHGMVPLAGRCGAGSAPWRSSSAASTSIGSGQYTSLCPCFFHSLKDVVSSITIDSGAFNAYCKTSVKCCELISRCILEGSQSSTSYHLLAPIHNSDVQIHTLIFI